MEIEPTDAKSSPWNSRLVARGRYRRGRVGYPRLRLRLRGQSYGYDYEEEPVDLFLPVEVVVLFGQSFFLY